MASNKIWKVQFTDAARDDLKKIIGYFLVRGEVETGRKLARKIRSEAIEKLKSLPLKGRVVPELEPYMRKFREVLVEPYRIIYVVDDKSASAVILMVCHNRQDLTKLTASFILGYANKQ